MQIKLVSLFICCIISGSVDSARILSAFIFPSFSHQIVYRAVTKELSLRGHEVVTITTDPLRDSTLENLTEIDISFAYDLWKNRDHIIKVPGFSPSKAFLETDFEIFKTISELVFTMPEVQELLKNDSKPFDLVLAEWIYPAMFGFSARFKCPLVGISSIDLLDALLRDIGNPSHPVVYPSFFLPFSTDLSFWERLVSIDFSIWMKNYFDFEIYPTSDKLIQKYLGNGLPPVLEMIRNVSMVFVNTNPLFSKPKLHVPAIIEFSGVHVAPPKKLPQDIQDFLDGAKNGAIYFSLGSNIKSHMLTEELKQKIVSTLNELPYKVLWKFDQNVENISSNIKIEKWLPQQDVLHHKNVKVFITQGGLQSLEEAIRRRVPLVSMPFIVDQPKNTQIMINLGIGQSINKDTLTKDSFKKVILEVAQNAQYKNKINKLAHLLEDEPVNSLDKIIWWIEYTIRHKGNTHLRSPFLDIPLYQHLFLDILAFALLICVTVSYVFYKLCKFLLRISKRKVKSA